MSHEEMNRTESEHTSQEETALPAPENRSASSDQILGDLLPAYSIGATDPEETEFVKSKLAANQVAVDELAEYAGLTQALLHSARPLSPSPSLADKLQASVRDDVKPQENSESVSLWERILGTGGQPMWPRLAVVTVLGLLMILNLLTWLNIRSLQVENEQLIAQLSNQQEGLALMLADDAEVYTLSPPDGTGESHASVRWNHDSNIALLTAEGFPELASDMAYQMWLIRDDERTDGGLFTVDSDGAGMLLIVAPEPLDNFDGMGITPEPATGSTGPTSPPVVRGTL